MLRLRFFGGQRMNDGLGIDPSVRYCDLQRRPVPQGQQPTYSSGLIETCELCQQPLAGLQYFADCALTGKNKWCILCQDCVAVHQVKFGWGTGQLYARERGCAAQWRLVAGYPVFDIED
jgi:hypothetical protein